MVGMAPIITDCRRPVRPGRRHGSPDVRVRLGADFIGRGGAVAGEPAHEAVTLAAGEGGEVLGVLLEGLELHLGIAVGDALVATHRGEGLEELVRAEAGLLEHRLDIPIVLGGREHDVLGGDEVVLEGLDLVDRDDLRDLGLLEGGHLVHQPAQLAELDALEPVELQEAPEPGLAVDGQRAPEELDVGTTVPADHPHGLVDEVGAVGRGGGLGVGHGLAPSAGEALLRDHHGLRISDSYLLDR